VGPITGFEPCPWAEPQIADKIWYNIALVSKSTKSQNTVLTLTLELEDQSVPGGKLVPFDTFGQHNISFFLCCGSGFPTPIPWSSRLLSDCEEVTELAEASTHGSQDSFGLRPKSRAAAAAAAAAGLPPPSSSTTSPQPNVWLGDAESDRLRVYSHLTKIMSADNKRASVNVRFDENMTSRCGRAGTLRICVVCPRHEFLGNICVVL
jgi:hypothetical protein